MAMNRFSRRSVTFISGVALVAAVAVLESRATGSNNPGREHGAFPNGVAAGDVTPTTAILWARSDRRGPLLWSYQARGDRRDWGFGFALAGDPAVPVQVKLRNLEPDTRYVYGFVSLTGDTSTGVFATPAQPYALHGLRFGVTGDARRCGMRRIASSTSSSTSVTRCMRMCRRRPSRVPRRGRCRSSDSNTTRCCPHGSA
jgi:phosphodiesterase/alkaline phosphatase D-like protein